LNRLNFCSTLSSGDTEHGAVGGDQRQVDAERLVEAGLAFLMNISVNCTTLPQ
jgi:hypothetical protein